MIFQLSHKRHSLSSAIITVCLVSYIATILFAGKSANAETDMKMIALPNPDLNILTVYNDIFSDSNGYRAFPWGIEIWSGSPESYFEGGSPGIVRLIGKSQDDAIALAIPNTIHKPKVIAGANCTQSFEVKLENITGNYGVRVIHQWFNTSSKERFQSDYGPFENGTSDWHTISLRMIVPEGAVLGDPILELWGTGTVYVRNPRFYQNTLNETNTPTTALPSTSNLPSFPGNNSANYWADETSLRAIRNITTLTGFAIAFAVFLFILKKYNK